MPAVPFMEEWGDPEICVKWDDLDGHTLRANDALENVLGIRFDQFPDASPYSRLHPDDLPVVAAYHQGVIDGVRGEQLVFRFKTPTGMWRWIRLQAELYGDPDHGKVIVSRQVRYPKATVAQILTADGEVRLQMDDAPAEPKQKTHGTA